MQSVSKLILVRDLLSRGLQFVVFVELLAALIYFSYLVIMMHGDFRGGGYKMPDADFTNIWSAGLLARTGRIAQLYSSAGFQAFKNAHVGHVVLPADWIYPPMMLNFGGLASLFSLPVAFWIWNISSVAVMIVLLRMLQLGWLVILITIASPAEYRCLTLGQFGGVLGCLTFAGLLLAESRPLLTGGMLGLVSMKPQAGMLVPIALLAARYWQAFFAAALFVLLLGLLPVLWFGWPSWMLFFAHSGTEARAVLQAPFGQSYQLSGVSVFWMMRSLGSSNRVAYVAQVVVGMVAMAVAYRAWTLRGLDRQALVALTMLLSLYLTPYAYTTDMVGYTLSLAVLAERRNWRVNLMDGLFWLWPGYIPLATAATGVLLTPLVIALASIMAWRQMRRPA